MEIELNSTQTYYWAHDPTKSWPCSKISGKKLFVELDDNGDLLDYSIDNKTMPDLEVAELNAIIDDYKAGYFK